MKRKQFEETQERGLADLVGDIQDVIDYLEEKKKEGWQTIDFDWLGAEDGEPLVCSIVYTRYHKKPTNKFEK